MYRHGLSGSDLDEMLRTWDYGLDAGVGMESRGARGSVYVDVRYEVGLTNLFVTSDHPDLRTRAFVFSVGLST